MKIILVAGGLGTRIKSITKNNIPKCMIDINGKPLIQHQIEFLRDKGYKKFILCIGYLGDGIKEYFGNGKKIGVAIEYSEEPLKLGTAGAVKLAEAKIETTCAVCYGDILTNVDLAKVIKFHNSIKSEFTVVVRKRTKGKKDSSFVEIKDNRIISFVEHPEFLIKEEGHINNSIYIMNKSIFQYIPKETKYDFAKDLIPDLIKKGINICAYVSDDFFRELGRTEKYEKFKKEIKGKSSFFR